MADAWSGLSQGLDRGLRLGMAFEGNRERKEDRLRRRGIEDRLFNQQQEDRTRRIGREDTLFKQQEADRTRRHTAEDLRNSLTKKQIAVIDNEKDRKETLASLNAILYSIKSTQDDPEGTAELHKRDKSVSEKLKKDIQKGGKFIFGDSGKSGEIDPSNLEPVGLNENGEMEFAFKVKAEDGSDTYITDDRKKGGEKTTFTLDEMAENVAGYKALITQIESQQIAAGDMGPLNRMRASKVAQSKAATDKAKAAQKHKYDLALARVKKKDPSVKDRLVEIGDDPMTGEKQYARYDAATQQLIPVTSEQGGLSSLPPEQQRPLAIQMMQEQKIKPEESNYLGFGDDTYSDDQINAFIGEQSLGGGISQYQPPSTTTQPPGTQPTQEDVIQSVLKSNGLEDTPEVREQIAQAARSDPKLKALFAEQTDQPSALGQPKGQYQYKPKERRTEPRKEGGLVSAASKSIDKFSKLIKSGKASLSLQERKRVQRQIRMIKSKGPTASEKAQIKIIEQYLNS